mmetsp:Transcript_31070/g.68979  ORF Transcript_31070/g.68979 Transcript_31070/m.68979 type:complete len:261 (+) Transcript_31070:1086-1868(+)
MPASRALLVPAPRRPSASTAFCATSTSVSWLNLLSVSMAAMSGLLMWRAARARGTARRTGASPYCSRCSSARAAMRDPRGSAMAMRAMPMTAGPWCTAFQLVPSSVSMCSPHMASSSCTLSTSPVPAYASDSRVTWQNLEMCSFRVLDTSRVASTTSCLARNSRPRPKHRYLAKGVCSSASERHISAWRMAITMSSLQVLVNTRPSASAAKPEISMLTSVSVMRGTSSSWTSSRLVPAYARPRPRMAPVRMVGSALPTYS